MEDGGIVCIHVGSITFYVKEFFFCLESKMKVFLFKPGPVSHFSIFISCHDIDRLEIDLRKTCVTKGQMSDADMTKEI